MIVLVSLEGAMVGRGGASERGRKRSLLQRRAWEAPKRVRGGDAQKTARGVGI